MLGMVWVFFAIMNYIENGQYDYDGDGSFVSDFDITQVNAAFLDAAPWVIGIIGIWFVIAYFSNTAMIRHAVGARPLTRKENPRVYNIVENLCMTCNMDMPKINVHVTRHTEIFHNIIYSGIRVTWTCRRLMS